MHFTVIYCTWITVWWQHHPSTCSLFILFNDDELRHLSYPFSDCSFATALQPFPLPKWLLCSVVRRPLLPTYCRSWLRCVSPFPPMWAVSSDQRTVRDWCYFSRTSTCPNQTNGVPVNCPRSFSRCKVGELFVLMYAYNTCIFKDLCGQIYSFFVMYNLIVLICPNTPDSVVPDYKVCVLLYVSSGMQQYTVGCRKRGAHWVISKLDILWLLIITLTMSTVP